MFEKIILLPPLAAFFYNHGPKSFFHFKRAPLGWRKFCFGSFFPEDTLSPEDPEVNKLGVELFYDTFFYLVMSSSWSFCPWHSDMHLRVTSCLTHGHVCVDPRPTVNFKPHSGFLMGFTFISRINHLEILFRIAAMSYLYKQSIKTLIIDTIINYHIGC